jgi:hypothetical protein
MHMSEGDGLESDLALTFAGVALDAVLRAKSYWAAARILNIDGLGEYILISRGSTLL